MRFALLQPAVLKQYAAGFRVADGPTCEARALIASGWWFASSGLRAEGLRRHPLRTVRPDPACGRAAQPCRQPAHSHRFSPRSVAGPHQPSPL